MPHQEAGLGTLMATAIPAICLDGTATVLSWHGRTIHLLEQQCRREVRTGGCLCERLVSPTVLSLELPQGVTPLILLLSPAHRRRS